MKVCPKCKATKPLADFYRNRSREDGRAHTCKVCENAAAKERDLANPAVRKAARARWTEKNPDAVEAKHQRYLERNRDQVLERKRERREANPLAYIERRYGLTPDQFEAMKANQQGCCAICDEPADRLHIDHDHGTGEVRGLLCKKCNLALGFLRDSPEIASRAADYLRRDHEISRPLERSA